MKPAIHRAAILVVDDDAVLARVIGQALEAAGHEPTCVGDVAAALRWVEGHVPAAALIDLHLPDGNALDLAREIHGRHPCVPLILMTGDAKTLDDKPELKEPFVSVLTKPLDIGAVRRAVDAALAGAAAPVETVTVPSSVQAAHDHPPQAKRHANPFFKAVQSAGLLLIAGIVLVIFLGFVLGVQLPGMSAKAEDIKIEPKARLGVDTVKDKPHTLLVPEAVRAALGIRKNGKDLIVEAQKPTATRPLKLYGSTALDPTRLWRARLRFQAEVVQFGKTVDENRRTETGMTAFRELAPGDRVQKGEVLCVFFSADVGSKKNDLLDALVQLELDQEIYDKMNKRVGSVPEVLLLTQWRQVQGDRNAINRALNNLKVWNIPQDEIDALHAEAKKMASDKNAWFKTPEGRWVKGEKQAKGKVDVDAENENPWGKVTLRAPFDGVLVERNCAMHEMVVDNTVNLFQVADVRRLLVIANAPEDELPTLNALSRDQKVWTVDTVGAKSTTGMKGPIEEISYLVDPNQHTAIIKGYIDNPGEQIRGGQYVTCTIQIPPPGDVVEVPIDAVVEDGSNCVVFVQSDPAKAEYTMRRVQLTHRFEKTAFVRSKPFAENERLTAEEKELGMQPLEPLLPGERVLRSGVGELKAALIDLESRPAKDSKEPKAN